MNAQHSCSISQTYLKGFFVLLALLFLNLPILAGTMPRSALANSGSDLLYNIPVVDENTIDNAACGVASATMILDYYRLQSGSVDAALDIHTVAKYVKEDSKGTSGSDLQTGIEAASNSPELQISNPLKASWFTTDSANWFTTLKSELDAKRPVIVFIPNGRNLGWSWNYPHFIVVSGYTSDNSIIYHDPWDGQPHTLSNAAFTTAWGTQWQDNPPWWYMQIMSSVPPTSIPATSIPPTQVSSPSPSTILPGGMWTEPSPKNGDTVTDVIHFAAHAYPTHSGDPAIAHVNFTVGSQGSWKVACTASPPANGDVFACDVNLKALGIPYGQIQVSFDVYDQAGNVHLAPNGLHTLTYMPLSVPTPTQSPSPTPTPTATPTATPTPTPTPTQPPTPTPTPVTLPSGTWQDPYGGANYNGDSVNMTISVQGTSVSGTMTGNLGNVTVPCSGTTGPLSSFSLQDQGYLNNVIQHYGSGTGVFLVVTISADFEGVGTSGSTYYMVLQNDGRLQGFWYFPNQSIETGALTFNRIS